MTAGGGVVESAFDAVGRLARRRVISPTLQRAVGSGEPEWVGPRPVGISCERTYRYAWDGELSVEQRTYSYADDGFSPAAHRDVRQDALGEAEEAWVHYVHDPIGTPEKLVNARGEIVGELRRTAWGRTEAVPGSKATTPMRFQGQYEDAETGLHYSQFRYYDPDTGRFISIDPIGLDAGPNLFRYPDNPTGRVDPLGLTGCQCVLVTKHGIFRSNSANPEQNQLDPLVQKKLDPILKKAEAKKKPSHPKGQCAEPHVLTKYFQQLRSQGWDDDQIMSQGLDDIDAIVPMERYDGPGSKRAGSAKAPCKYCNGLLHQMGLRDKVKGPEVLSNHERGVKKGKL